MTNRKKGQITLFIIIGLIILLVIGTVLYLTNVRVTKEYESIRPTVAEIPQFAEPLRSMVESCINRLATDGLRKIGDSGGYIDQSQLSYNTISPTEGNAVQLSPGAGPLIAYWWHMKSRNDCLKDCLFESKRPGLYRADGGVNIEAQLDEYVTSNLRDCLGNFEEYSTAGCTVQELGEPKIIANVAANDLFFVGTYPLRAVCESQSFDMEDYYTTINLNLREIYNLATELTNYESQERVLEQATKALISTYSEVDSSRLPPPRALEVGPPQAGTFWIKFKILEQLKGLLMSHVPLIQTAGVRNYRYIAAPPGTRDPEHYEVLYNRQFFIPLNTSHPKLEARFSYLDWWEPYFDLNCNGQLCQADSASSFAILPITINRYNFAYDISYPVLVEIRNPKAFNAEGYSFKIFLEQNMRNSDTFTAELPPFAPAEARMPPSIFCSPEQRTSGEARISVTDGKTLKGMEQATVSYLCGDNNCNVGTTSNGTLNTKLPRCVGGTLRVTKNGYESHSTPLDTLREEQVTVRIMLEPVRILKATVKNYAITKPSKWGSWEYREGGLLRPSDNQTTTIQLTRNSTAYEEPYASVVQLDGDTPGELNLVPGNYSITISSFLRENLTIPKDQRCVRIRRLFGSSRRCFWVPDEPVNFNATSPFPYGGAEYEYEITSSMLRGAKAIEFRQFIIAIDKVPEQQRIVEDLNQVSKVQLYSTANLDKIYPVIT